MTTKKAKSFIGIDVCKQLLEVAAHESDFQFRCANKTSGFAELIGELIKLRPALIVLEATGGLEIPVTAALQAAGLPVVVIECKSPKVKEPIPEAIDQLLRYSEQRGDKGTAPLRSRHALQKEKEQNAVRNMKQQVGQVMTARL